ncbi:MAG: hypothetical protein CMJ58_04255 [Planctomycetaceae bacterium]|nr:hypothetical protein [Planctomycetaceae bacterium]
MASTLGELTDCATAETARLTGGRQHPRVASTGSFDKQLVISRVTAPKPPSEAMRVDSDASDGA